MNRIKTLTLDGWKGHTGTWDIGPLNLLIGPNDSGKSSIEEAIRWAITGTSKAGEAATAAIVYSHGQLVVQIALESGFTWKRSLSRDADGKVSQSLSVVGAKRLSQAEAEAEIRQACGSFVEVFDLGYIRGLSADKKRDFFVDLCGGAETDDASIPDRLALEWFRLRLGPGTVDAHAVHVPSAGLIPHLLHQLGKPERFAYHRAFPAITQQITGEQSEAIRAALDKATEMANASKREHVRLSAAIQELSEREARLQVPAATAVELTAKLDGLNAEALKIEGLIGTHRERPRTRSAIQARIDGANDGIGQRERLNVEDYPKLAAIQEGRSAANLTANLRTAEQAEARADRERRTAATQAQAAAGAVDAAVARLTDLKMESADVDALRRELAEAESRVVSVDVQGARQAVQDAQRRVRDAETALATADREHGEAYRQAQAAADDVAAAEADPWGRALALWVQIQAHRDPGPAYQRLDALIREHASAVDLDGCRGIQAAATERVDAARDQMAAAKAAHVDTVIAEEQASSRYGDAIRVGEEQARLRNTIDRLRVDIASAESRETRIAEQRDAIARLEEVAAKSLVTATAAEAAHAEARQNLADARHAAELGQARDSIQRDVDRRTSEIDRLKNDRFAAEQELIDLNADGTADVADLERQKIEIVSDIHQCKIQLNSRQGADNLRKELLSCRENCESEQVYHEVCKTFVAAIKVLRETLVDRLLAPLTAHVDAFLATAMPGHKFYYNLTGSGKRCYFDMGISDGDTRVSMDALGGGRLAMFWCALIVGMLRLKAPPLSLVMLEAGEIGTANLHALCAALESADVGNCIVGTWIPSEYPEALTGLGEAWRVIDLQPISVAN